MKKQISFEQNGLQTCLINVKNVFGFSINYVEDKIKKHSGRWDRKSRKFQVPLSFMADLAKDLRQIDRSFCVEQVPAAVGEMLTRHAHPDNKIKKQLLVDGSFVQRYSYVGDTLIKSIMGTCQGLNKSKNYDKILVVTMECKVQNWIEFLPGFKVRRLKFEASQFQTCLNENFVWVCSYENIWQNSEQINKYCFQTIIIDEAQNLAQKLNSQHDSALSFRRFLISRHFIFPILTKLPLAKLSILIPLLSIILPPTNFQWFSRRYKKQNISQLNFLLKACCLYRNINSTVKKEDSYQHYFHKWVTPISENCLEKIKGLNKKYNQIEQRKILENPSNARNKSEKLYIESVNGVLRQDKLEQIYKIISYYCLELNLKLAVILQTSSVYRSIQNFLCERQISYCHFQHHHQVLEFNKNPTILVCLIKSQYLAKITFSKPLSAKDEVVSSTKLDNYEPEQYLCLSGVKNVIFPDLEWLNQVKTKEQSIRQLFKFTKSDVIRHYFLLKGTYEEKWMKQLEQTLIKIQVNIKIKEDLQEELDEEEIDDPVLAFSELNLARTQEQYSHLQVIKGVTDIDEQFDRLEFEALQQKLEKQSKKKKKEEKARQKLLERKSQMQIVSLHEKVQASPISLNNQDEIEYGDKEYEQHKQKCARKIKPPTLHDNKVVIYEPIAENEYRITRKNKSQEGEVNMYEKAQDNLETKVTVQVGQRLEQSKAMLESEEQQMKQAKNGEIFKDDETEEAEIIQVRKPPPKPKVPKRKSQNMMVILRPSVG